MAPRQKEHQYWAPRQKRHQYWAPDTKGIKLPDSTAPTLGHTHNRGNKPNRHGPNNIRKQSFHERALHLRRGRFNNFTFVSFFFICLLIQLSVGKDLIHTQYTAPVTHSAPYGTKQPRLAGVQRPGPPQKTVEYERTMGKNRKTDLLTNHRLSNPATDKNEFTTTPIPHEHDPHAARYDHRNITLPNHTYAIRSHQTVHIGHMRHKIFTWCFTN